MNFVSRNNPKELSSTALTLVTLSFASFIANGVLAQEIGREVELEPITVQASTEMARKRTTTIGALSEEAAGGFTAKGARLGQLGNREIAKTPFSITAFTAKAIRDQQAQTIIDIVRNDPSVRSDAPAFSDRDSFVIRGFPITGDNTFFDGQANIANARRVHLEGIERVEALKGPSAMLSGGIGRVGGSINVIPKRADDEPLTRLTTTYASKSQLGNHIDIGRRFGENGEWGVRGNAAYRFGKTALDHNEIKVGALALGLDYRGDDLRATLDIQHGSQKLDAPTSLFNTAKPNVVIPKAPKGSINTGNPFEYHDSRQSFIAGRVEYDLNEDTTIYAAGGASRYYEDFLTSNFVLTNNNGVGYGEFGYNPMRFTGYNGEIGLRTSFDTGAIGHDLSLSATKSVFENNRGRFHPRILGFKEFGTNIFKPSYVPSNFVDTSPAPRSNDLYPFADLHSTSLAISDTLSFSEGFVELTLGGRYQKMRSRGFNTRPGNAEYPVGEINYLNEDSRFSPSIAGVVNVTDEVALYANYIEALTEISPPGRAANFDQVFPLVVSRQKEIGVKYELGDVLLTAALFEIRQPNGLTDPASNVFSISGQQLNRGLELNATGEVADGLRLLGGVTFLDASLTKTAGGETDGNKVPGIPTTNLVLYGEYDTPWVDNLTLTGRVTHASSTFFDQTNNQKISGWTKLDLGARYKFERENSKPIELRFAVDNVLNENYWASSTRGFLAAGAPRTFKVSAAFEF